MVQPDQKEAMLSKVYKEHISNTEEFHNEWLSS